jgi:hypothetical protein
LADLSVWSLVTIDEWLSIEARKRAWGEDEFRNRLRECGKLGGRPKGSRKNQTNEGGK